MHRYQRRVRGITLLAVVALITTALLAAPANADYGSGDIGGWEDQPVITTGVPLDQAQALIVGDSITARCWPDLRDWLTANSGPTLAVNYRAGRPTDDGLNWLGAQQTRPPLTVIALGTNDIFNPPVMATEAQKAIQLMLDPTGLVWVDVQAARTSQSAAVQLADQRNSGWINAQIYSALPAAQVVPWAEQVAATTRTGRPGIGYYLQDGVHPWASAGTGHGDGCAFWGAIVGQVIKQRWVVANSGTAYTPPSPTTSPTGDRQAS
jgi:lysophospholipase L1-like esterase